MLSILTAIDISENIGSDKNEFFQSTSFDSESMPQFVSTGFPLTCNTNSEDFKNQVKAKKTKVSPLSVDEELVREALGISPTVTSSTEEPSIYNPTFSKDRERNIQVIRTFLRQNY